MTDPISAAVTITAKPNGPYLVAGPVTLVDPTGKAVPLVAGRPVALCRCGHSSMKPFCDGSHSRTGFQAAEAAPAR
jgi:CDGSH-type Zn-finger protein